MAFKMFCMIILTIHNENLKSLWHYDVLYLNYFLSISVKGHKSVYSAYTCAIRLNAKEIRNIFNRHKMKNLEISFMALSSVCIAEVLMIIIAVL